MQGAAKVQSIERDAVRVGSHSLPGEWVRPAQAVGLVVFVQGSGGVRGSPRNRFVASVLHQHRLATLRFDLLGEGVAHDRHPEPDIGLLTQRLVDALDWLRAQTPDSSPQCVCLFGAGCGAAAALCAAAERPGRVSAVVSRSGRTDLAAEALPRVQAPTLLVAGGADRELLQANRAALRVLWCEKRLEIVPGAGPLFDEPGALDAVAQLAAQWFIAHGPPSRL